MASILVFCEKDEIGFELLTKANELAANLGLQVTAAALGSVNAMEYATRGAADVYTCSNNLLDTFEASVYAETLGQIAKQAEASVIILGSTRRGKELAGRLAQKLNCGCLTDVSKMELQDGRIVCSRNAFGGATVASQTILSGTQVIAVAPGAFSPAEKGSSTGEIKDLTMDLNAPKVRILSREEKPQASVNIEGAEVLVCIGKGLRAPEELKMVEDLANALGGIVCCTKPVATDQKWLPEDRIIGLSGKKGKPQLALCLGISGQVQFTVGIRDAKTIVAVNTDQNAYIYQMADYGIIEDLHQVIPQLTAALK
ncbi:MAG: electron transfer flavoprotein subunit alpha/FixB family protein [Chitinophagales bacterium]